MPTFLEVPPEVADGIRTRFTVSTSYASGSVSGIVRGLYRRVVDSDFGCKEINPNIIQFNTAPLTGDPVIISYKAG